jgi:hypothetical protein
LQGNRRRRRISYRTALPPASGDPRLLRHQWSTQPWTRKSCCICGSPSYQLHHASYDALPVWQQLLVLAPLCARHHDIFEREIWPRLRRRMPRWRATLAYVVSGEAFAVYARDSWDEPDRLHVHPDQLTLA